MPKFSDGWNSRNILILANWGKEQISWQLREKLDYEVLMKNKKKCSNHYENLTKTACGIFY
jgi:hypothetical protein